MKNYIQDGNVLTLVAPAGGVIAGNIVIISATLFAVATTTEVAGDNFEGVMSNEVFNFTKTTANAPAQGANAYWNDVAKEVTTTAGGNTLVGKFVKAYINGDIEAEVRLNNQ
jgi:predicted RecA/RadA family phage recombinase